MLQQINRFLFTIQIKVLMLIKPAILFKKINELDWYKETFHKWISENSSTSKLKILEVGCAIGILSEYLTELGHNVKAIDYSKDMVKFATSGKHSAEYYVADVNYLPFNDNEFDLVISASVLNIVPDQHKAITEMKRVCKQGGVISAFI